MSYDGASFVGGICRRVHGPGASPENECTAECLSGEWAALQAATSGNPNFFEVSRYVVWDHRSCYSQCGYGWGQFGADFVFGAGTRARGTARPERRCSIVDVGAAMYQQC